MKRFRRWLLGASGLFSAISLLILTTDPSSDCPGSNLRKALWLTFSIHITTFLMLLLHFIYLGFILRYLGRLLGLYYVYLVGAMIAAQVVFFNGNGKTLTQTGAVEVSCFKHSPGMYTWLVLQIAVFYGLVAYGIALCGSYICWEADVEELKIKEAMK